MLLEAASIFTHGFTSFYVQSIDFGILGPLGIIK